MSMKPSEQIGRKAADALEIRYYLWFAIWQPRCFSTSFSPTRPPLCRGLFYPPFVARHTRTALPRRVKSILPRIKAASFSIQEIAGCTARQQTVTSWARESQGGKI